MDAGELGEDAVEQPAVVHLGQPRVETRARSEHAPSSCWRSPSVATKSSGGVALDVLLDAGERLLRHRAAVRRARSGTARATATARDAARVGIEEADALGGDLEVAADVPRRRSSRLRSRRAPHPAERPRRRPRACRKYSPISVSTRCCDCRPSQPNISATFSCSSWVSTLTSRPLSRCRIERTRSRNSSASCSCSRGAIALGVGAARLQQPRCCRAGGDVAQPARRVLDVRLELVDRVVERRVPLVDELQQRVEQLPPVRRRRGRATHASSRWKSRSSPAMNRTSSSASRNSALPRSNSAKSESSRTCWPTVSPRSQSGCSSAPTKRSSLERHRVLEEDQQVDVGVQAERSPAVAAERADRHGRAGVRPRSFRELLHQRVDAARVAGLHVPPAAAVPRGGDVFLTSIAKHGAGRRLVPFGT